MDQHNLDSLKQRLAEYAAQKCLLALYLFGSVAQGKMGSWSDLDVAVLLPEPLTKSEAFSHRLAIPLDLMTLAPTNEPDVVILNSAPPLLKHRVIPQGKVLYSRDERARQRFEMRAILEYLDFKPICKRRSNAS